MNEIMILRNDVDGKTHLKKFLVDDNVPARLVKIRGNLYADDSRLRTVAELPTMIREPQHTAAPVITPEIHRKAEEALFLHKMMQAAGERSRTAAIQPQPPQPERPKTPEELWRHDPMLRAEFNNNLNAYLAYCKAAEAGRAKLYGQGTSTR